MVVVVVCLPHNQDVLGLNPVSDGGKIGLFLRL